MLKMLKEQARNLARKVLAKELESQGKNETLLNLKCESLNKQITRLSALVNMLNKEVNEGRGYVFDAGNLTDEEKNLMGRHHDHEIVGLFKKWFKQKADENSDLLMHGQDKEQAVRYRWELAVRMYDDFNMQLTRCQKMFSKKTEDVKKKKERNEFKTKDKDQFSTR